MTDTFGQPDLAMAGHRSTAYRTTAARAAADVTEAAPRPAAALQVQEQQRPVLQQLTEAQMPVINEDNVPSFWQALGAARKSLAWGGTLTNAEGETYLGWGDEHALTVAALWAAHTQARWPCHNLDHITKEGHVDGAPGMLALRATPRLALFAVVAQNSKTGEGSGKTHLARLLGGFCAVPAMETGPTTPVLARIIGVEHSTMFLDEAAGYLGDGKRMALARSILENGYSRSHLAAMSGSTARMWGNKIYRVPNFGPVSLVTVSNPQLEGSPEMQALLSRFITIRFKQAPKGFRPPRISEKDGEIIQGVSDTLRIRLMAAAPWFAESEFRTPDYMTPRQGEIWESMGLIATFADADRADYAAKTGYDLKPVWVPRMLAAADWYVNHGEERLAAAAMWAQVQQAPWMQGGDD